MDLSTFNAAGSLGARTDVLAFADALTDAVIVAESSGQILFANRAACALLGWAAGDLVGQAVSVLVPARLRDAHETGFRRYSESGEGHIIGVPIRLSALRADGHEVAIELLISELNVADGERFVIGTLRDVAQRLDLERESALVHQILDVITHSTGSGKIQRLLSAIGTSLGYPMTNLWVLDGGGRTLGCDQTWTAPTANLADFVDITRATALPRGVGLPGRVWASGDPAWITDLAVEPNFPRSEAARRAGLGSGLAFGLVAPDRGVVGVIELFRHERFEPETALLTALSFLGSQLGAWLEHSRIEADRAELANRERRVADELRRSLLPPSLPSIEGLDLAARFRPGGDIAVGGDFYDSFELDPGALCLAIGDVCGQGAEAASVTAQVRYTIRALAPSAEAPAAVLQRTNEALLARPETNARFCTAVLGFARRHGPDVRVRLASAGHPLPLIVRSDGAVDTVKCRGSLLGVLADGSWDDVEVTLRGGDSLVLYTDGVSEAHIVGHEQFGDTGFAALLSTLAGADADTLVQAVQDAAVQHAGTSPDDIAVLIMRVNQS